MPHMSHALFRASCQPNSACNCHPVRRLCVMRLLSPGAGVVSEMPLAAIWCDDMWRVCLRMARRGAFAVLDRTMARQGRAHAYTA
eukprot:CAMPEP_0181248080 /NCGR_PEP_ID=MMETSP1096-20121128/44969_1 /TAXON_ID=156174 ORGANISM="Chrysochromulina ericina, Strain CCMP281" /NCGR_SAMPLE_ID=MMETSP1096 /ASSEMBLY_ACC=CAM_ASM_000453 /LENGTH=84 /DNA_ID=CAMNT_0023345205 /DNA_START=259 /DNA_END=511 /DNA_ORIENTATION=-